MPQDKDELLQVLITKYAQMSNVYEAGLCDRSAI